MEIEALDSVLTFDGYCEIVETLAEAAHLMVGMEMPWSDNEDDYLDQIDRLINTSRILVHDAGEVLALSPNREAFWEEYTITEIEDLIEELGGKGNMTALMAYYAFQADVICSVKDMINNLDTALVIG